MSNYSDLTRPGPPTGRVVGEPPTNVLSSGKCRLVKYNNLPRSIKFYPNCDGFVSVCVGKIQLTQPGKAMVASIILSRTVQNCACNRIHSGSLT